MCSRNVNKRRLHIGSTAIKFKAAASRVRGYFIGQKHNVATKNFVPLYESVERKLERRKRLLNVFIRTSGAQSRILRSDEWRGAIERERQVEWRDCERSRGDCSQLQSVSVKIQFPN